jgi:hypothetical protein
VTQARSAKEKKFKSAMTDEMRAAIGEEWPAYAVEVDKHACRLFAQAAGYSDPIYYDEKTAQAKGYRNIPAPMGFLGHAALPPGKDDPLIQWEDPIIKSYFRFKMPLHINGRTDIEYFEDVCAGDVLRLKCKVVEIYEKPGTRSMLLFVVTDMNYYNPAGELVARFRATAIAFEE